MFRACLALLLIPALALAKPPKLVLVAQGFDPAMVTDPLYVHDRAAGYQALTPEAHAEIVEGRKPL